MGMSYFQRNQLMQPQLGCGLMALVISSKINVVSSLGKLSRKHKVHVICSCSATIHGKGPVDGVATTVKREAGQKICPKQLSSNNLDDFEKAVANLKSIKTTKILSLLPSLSLKNSLRITSSSKNYSIPLHMPCKWSY